MAARPSTVFPGSCPILGVFDRRVSQPDRLLTVCCFRWRRLMLARDFVPILQYGHPIMVSITSVFYPVLVVYRRFGISKNLRCLLFSK